MYVKNSNFAIYLVLAALVGFGISFLFLSSNVPGSLLSGDISKANVYSNQKDDPEFSLIEEKLQNDEEFFNTTKDAATLIENRASSLEELTEKTLNICSDIPELKDVIKTVVSLNAKAYNTKQFASVTSSSLDKLASGKKAPEYEQASTNMYIGFNKIDNQLSIGKAFVENALTYLEGKEGEEYNPIIDLVAEWSFYCAENSYLMGNDDMAYWADEITVFTYPEALGSKFQESFGSKFQESFGSKFQESFGSKFQEAFGSKFQESFGSKFQESFGSQFQESFGSKFQESFGSQFQEAFGSKFQESFGSKFQESFGSKFQEAFGTNSKSPLGVVIW